MLQNNFIEVSQITILFLNTILKAVQLFLLILFPDLYYKILQIDCI